MHLPVPLFAVAFGAGLASGIIVTKQLRTHHQRAGFIHASAPCSSRPHALLGRWNGAGALRLQRDSNSARRGAPRL